MAILSFVFYNLFLEPLSQESKSWTMFNIFIGIWDFVSDVTMLALIEPFNPYGLFWISLGAIALSLIASVLLASISNINASWPVRIVIFIASCGNLIDSPEGSAQLCFNWSPEVWNHIAILVVEQAPQLVVQCLLLYLQGIQGFSSLDWAIWCQSATFTLVNAVKNIKLVFVSRQLTQSAAASIDTQMEASSLAMAGAGGLLAFGVTA